MIVEAPRMFLAHWIHERERGGGSRLESILHCDQIVELWISSPSNGVFAKLKLVQHPCSIGCSISLQVGKFDHVQEQNQQQ